MSNFEREYLLEKTKSTCKNDPLISLIRVDSRHSLLGKRLPRARFKPTELFRKLKLFFFLNKGEKENKGDL